MKNVLKVSARVADIARVVRCAGLRKWLHKFTHAGKPHTLFKRLNSGEAHFYVHFQIDGARYKRCLDTSDPAVGEIRARALMDKILDLKWAAPGPVKAAPQPLAIEGQGTLADVIAVYAKVASIEPRTVQNNILCLRKILEQTTGRKDDPAVIPLSAINELLVTKFQDDAIKAYLDKAPQLQTAHREARDRALRSSKSRIKQARSLFAAHDQDLRKRYADAGIVLPPCIDGFMTVKLRGRPSSKVYVVAPPELVLRTFQAIEEMKDDRDLYLGFWLCVGPALRRKEAAFCQWEHLIERDGSGWVYGGIGKNGQVIQVPIQGRAWKAIKALRKEKASGFVIKNRSYGWARRLSKWMRGLGWETQKTLHELRAYVGSLVYQKSPLAAKDLLRHTSIRVTEQNYCRYVQQSLPIDVL